MKMRSKKNELAVTPPTFTKIEAKLNSGFATIGQRSDCQTVSLVMDYAYDGVTYLAGETLILLRGDSGLKPWAKSKFNALNVEFVLCPEVEVLGFITPDPVPVSNIPSVQYSQVIPFIPHPVGCACTACSNRNNFVITCKTD